MINLSQSHFNCLENCPPQFQRIYLENLATPTTAEQFERLSWGGKFHLLMQQWSLGLPIDRLLKEDEQLKKSFEAILEEIPELGKLQPTTWQQAEHCRTLNVLDVKLTVIYDFLIADPITAQILDWKTYPKPENIDKILKNWQTRLYLYVLAETSEYLPEQIFMSYWFIRLPQKPEKLTIPYDRHQHQKTHQDLTNLLTELDGWLKDYQNEGINFPHQDKCETICPHHKFFQPEREKTTESDLSSSIAELQEVSL